MYFGNFILMMKIRRSVTVDVITQSHLLCLRWEEAKTIHDWHHRWHLRSGVNYPDKRVAALWKMDTTLFLSSFPEK